MPTSDDHESDMDVSRAHRAHEAVIAAREARDRQWLVQKLMQWWRAVDPALTEHEARGQANDDLCPPRYAGDPPEPWTGSADQWDRLERHAKPELERADGVNVDSPIEVIAAGDLVVVPELSAREDLILIAAVTKYPDVPPGEYIAQYVGRELRLVARYQRRKCDVLFDLTDPYAGSRVKRTFNLPLTNEPFTSRYELHRFLTLALGKAPAPGQPFSFPPLGQRFLVQVDYYSPRTRVGEGERDGRR